MHIRSKPPNFRTGIGRVSEPPISVTTIAGATYRLQMILLEQGAPSERHLEAAASLLSRSDYSDVVTERAISELCGHPLCQSRIEMEPSPKHAPRYRISLSDHRVYDLRLHQEEAATFCSHRCFIASRAYQATLPEERSFNLSSSRVQDLLNLFLFPFALQDQEQEGGWRSPCKTGLARPMQSTDMFPDSNPNPTPLNPIRIQVNY